MKFQDRIDKIINYPANLKEAKDDNTGLLHFDYETMWVPSTPNNPLGSIAFYFSNPNYKENLIFFESDIFRYPAKEVIATASDADIVNTKVWGSIDNIADLEGYFIGYELGTKRVNFASLLNTPEFSLQFLTDINSTGSLIDTSFFYFLHSLPLNPPVPISDTVQKLVTSETFEPNPAILFKNNAGVYSLPDPYIWWLGGVWKKRNYRAATIPELPYIEFEGSVEAGWKNVSFAISKEYNTYFKSVYYPKILGRSDVPTLMVDTTKLYEPSEGFANLVVSITAGVYIDSKQKYGIDALNGIGNYQDLFNGIHKSIYGTSLPTTNLQGLINWNVDDKLRTFPTYSYGLGYQKELTLYATYSICNYSDVPPEDGNDNSLVKLLDTSDANARKSTFDFYTAIWNYIYYYLTLENGTLTYTDVIDKLVAYYTGVFTDEEIWALERAIFYPVQNDAEVVTSYGGTNPLVSMYRLFDGMDELRRFLDLIGLQVIEFYETMSPVDKDELTRYYVDDPTFTCVLYPSAGGVAGLQYVLSSMSSKMGKAEFEIDEYLAYSRDDNNEFTATVMNTILNSSRFVWGSGPFVGDAPYHMDALLKTENFDVIGSNLLLNTLDTDFLYDNNVHTKRANRTYILDSGRLHTSRVGSLLRYNDVIDYVGCGALEKFQGKYDEMITVQDGISDAKDLLLSILIVDRTDFATLKIGENTYDIDTQIELLLKYSVWLTHSFKRGDIFGKAGDKNIIMNMCKVMNASLTQAQTNKIKRVVRLLTDQRSLFNVGSVFDFGYEQTGSVVVKNMFDRALANGALNETDDAKFIKTALFGNQVLPAWGSTNSAIDSLYLKYYLRYNMTESDVIDWANYFFQKINIAPIAGTIKIAKDFMMLFFKQNSVLGRPDTEKDPSFAKLATIVRGWLDKSNKHVTACLTSVSKHLADAEKEVVKDQMKDFIASDKDDLNLMKVKTYYNIKSLFDNWIRVAPDKKTMQLQYSYTHFVEPNAIPSANDSLISHFLFVDRANRDVGHNMLANIDWLKSYFENNYGYNGVNTDISLYTFLSDLAKQHASLIHALPAFIDFGVYNVDEGNNSARDLFGTFDYVDIADSNPKFLFQFIGNTNTVLNTPQNKSVRTASKSYSLLSSRGNKKSNVSSNLGNGVNIPQDLMQTGATAMAFVVDFGEQHQQIFSNLQLDQSEYQNTEEWYKGITQYAKNRTQTQGGDLFSLFTERSYTAQVDSLGNMMIQPLMFFELTNIPLFYGTYWITNVKHSITPNDIKTTFKGVRQPMAVLPTQKDVLLQLSDSNISSLLGISAIGGTTDITEKAIASANTGTGTGTAGDGNTSGGGVTPLPKSVTQSLKFNQIVDVVIAKLEGGYWHPYMLDDGRIKFSSEAAKAKTKKDYSKSSETMYGMDRGYYIGANDVTVLRGDGQYINVRKGVKNQYTIKFWELIDAQNASQKWAFNYKPKDPLRGQLVELVAQMIFPVYTALSKQYLSAKAIPIVNADNRLTFNFIYATWNGAGWFKKFAKAINTAVEKGIVDPNALVEVALNARASAGNSLITRQVANIRNIMNNLQNLV